VEDIDKVLTVGYGHSLGVFRTADKMGIEKIVKLLNNLYDEYGKHQIQAFTCSVAKSACKKLWYKHRQRIYVYDESGNVVNKLLSCETAI